MVTWLETITMPYYKKFYCPLKKKKKKKGNKERSIFLSVEDQINPKNKYPVVTDIFVMGHWQIWIA